MARFVRGFDLERYSGQEKSLFFLEKQAFSSPSMTQGRSAGKLSDHMMNPSFACDWPAIKPLLSSLQYRLQGWCD
jgi:hypothetical protein